MGQLRDAVVVAAKRTPVGRYGGALAGVRPDDLAALVVREAVRASGVEPARIEDVILGCANQAGEDNRNVARMAALLAGLPDSVGGLTVNRLCGSGLDAVIRAGHAVQVNDGDVFVAGGVESMSRAPFVMAKPEAAFPRGDMRMYDTTLGWRFVNPRLAEAYHPYSMGETAENVAVRYGVSREEQDEYALESQRRAAEAMTAGRFDAELVPVEAPRRKGPPVIVDRDEHPRPETTLEGLRKLKPAFATAGSPQAAAAPVGAGLAGVVATREREDETGGGTVTAGNSSGVNDGAAALVVADAGTARELGLRPLARLVSSAVAGVDPAYMGMGPVPATRKALARAGLRVEDLDVIELNEAFAAQTVACIRELGLDPLRVNVNGGAIAFGHPLGSSGARLTTTLLHELGRRGARYGLVTMCVGVGQGIAAVWERVEA
jgi:acetyl-CoA acetyltransferase family protein